MGNFDTVVGAAKCMTGNKFEENPIRIDHDIETFIEHVRSGQDEMSIKKILKSLTSKMILISNLGSNMTYSLT